MSIKNPSHSDQERLALARLNAMRQDFIANVSHELRTPLTVFRGYLDLLQNQPAVNQEELQSILQLMSEQTTRMESLVQDLILLSYLESLEANPNSFQSVPVAQLIYDIMKDVVVLNKEKQHQIQLHLDENVNLIGNVEQLRSAFSNLIYNAIYYTKAEGRIKICWYQQEQYKVFKVIDNGIGIPAIEIPKITERFYRVDKSRSPNKGGSGLGLAIVKHVLAGHDGKLQINSQQGEGSEFCCVF